MKKETIFKHEINESVQANAALNCIRNRNTPKKLNESADFDARFEFRKDLRELASPVAKKAYMIIRKQYGDSMWRQLYMDDCDERGLIDMLNMFAEKGLNPQQIVNKMLGVREDEEEFDIEGSRSAYYSQDEPDYDDDSHGIRLIVNMLMQRGDIIKSDIPRVQKQIKSMLDAEGMWIGDDEREAERFIEMNWNNQEQEESPDEKYTIAKQLMANYNPDTDELEDPSAWLLCAIQERIGSLFLKMPKKEVKSWKQAIDAALNEYELEKEQEEHSEDADRVQSQLANAWDEGMEDDEDDYVPYENKFDETHHDIVDSVLDEVYRYFQFETDVEGFNLTEYTEEQIGKAIEQILDKTDDFPSSVSNNVCYAWVQKYAGEIIKVLERGSLENPYEGHPEFDFSEQEEDDVEDFISNVVNLMEDEGMIDETQWDSAYYTVEEMIQSNPELKQYPSYMQFLNVFADDILSKL